MKNKCIYLNIIFELQLICTISFISLLPYFVPLQFIVISDLESMIVVINVLQSKQNLSLCIMDRDFLLYSSPSRWVFLVLALAQVKFQSHALWGSMFQITISSSPEGHIKSSHIHKCYWRSWWDTQRGPSLLLDK